ncbi:chaperone modulator CbpM [Providencia sp.]|uniref:chaperone modulator CbpM n=1 Tax=Providencia sp. TaxID=589 RepID=UPI000E93E12A|nr:chaperone-modulator protein CbpM [Providencia sp.]HBO23894.1 chaperone-modulator protein CbpM [Providencia sp.]
MGQITTLTTVEFCVHTGIREDELNEIVGLGIVQPIISHTEWLFDDSAVVIVQRAVRLYHELEIDWPGIAITINLLEENELLKQENNKLHQQLKRFINS